MATIPELIRLYTKGFKRLLFLEGEGGERGRLSLLKVTFFTAYILAYVFAFLQFVETNIPEVAIQEYGSAGDYDALFPLSIYGELAHLMNVIIILGFFWFLFTREKPLKVVAREIYDACTRTKYHTIAAVATPLLFIVTTLYLYHQGVLIIDLTSGSLTNIITSLSYEAGQGLFYVWVVISPVLVLGAVLVSLDVFALDHPVVMSGYNRKNVSFFSASILVSLVLMGILFTVFNISLESVEPDKNAEPFAVEGLEGVFFYELGLYWLFQGIFIMLIAIFLLIILDTWYGYRRGSTELRERRIANLLVVIPFILIYVFLKISPVLITFGHRLKSLNNIIDLVSLFVVIFFGVFRVLSLEENTGKRDLNGKKWYNPERWLNSVPAYCKALALFYLAFAAYYASIEANAILTFYGIQNEFRLVKLNIAIGMLSVAIVYVFWRYKPISKTKLAGSSTNNLVGDLSSTG